MATFAVLNGDKVINITLAESKEIAETIFNLTCVEYTEKNPAGIGWTYDGENFIAPVVEQPTE
jgi:hypothetical protein